MLNKGPNGLGFGLGLKPWNYTASRDTGPRSSSVDYTWQEPGEVMDLNIDPERSWIRLLAIE